MNEDLVVAGGTLCGGGGPLPAAAVGPAGLDASVFCGIIKTTTSELVALKEVLFYIMRFYLL